MIIQELSHLKDWLEFAKAFPIVCYDCETTGFLCTDGKICTHGLAVQDSTGHIHTASIPVRHTQFALATSRGYRNLNPATVAKELHKFFGKTEAIIVGHNIKFDMGMLSKDWGHSPKQAFHFWSNKSIVDTMVLSHLINEEGHHGLKELGVIYLNDPPTERDAVKEELKAIMTRKKEPFRQSWLLPGKKRKYKPGWKTAQERWNKEYSDCYADVDIPLLCTYCESDVRKTLQLLDYLAERIEREGPGIGQAIAIEHGVIPVVVEMELTGMAIDTDYFHKLELEKMQELEQTEQLIIAMAPDCEITNAGIKKFLASRHIRLPQTEKGNDKTDKNVLKDLMETTRDEEVQTYCGLILHHRHTYKMLETYIRPLLKYAHFCNGIIHASFNNIATVTGRFSCSDPNLQNLPKKDIIIRSGFIPRPGFRLIAIDYDQMEMRMTQILTKDMVLKKILDEGMDPYKYMAGIGEAIDYDAVDKDTRGVYKTITLQTLYGSGLRGLLKVTPHAQRILDAFFKAFDQVRIYNNQLKTRVKWGQPIEMIGGRRRHLDFDGNYKAFNSQNQGSCAMIVKDVVRRRIAEFLQPYKSRLLCLVHDEGVFEVAEDEMHLVPELVERMTVRCFSVPLTASAEIGCPSWGSKKPYQAEKEMEA